MAMKHIKSYSELIQLSTYRERLQYLMLKGQVGEFTFNGHRYLNQMLYKCPEWDRVRSEAIIRDGGCDLALDDYEIHAYAFVHHINPITVEDILQRRHCVFDLENLITCSRFTHNQIHYGIDEGDPIIVSNQPVIRTPGDTCPWR